MNPQKEKCTHSKDIICFNCGNPVPLSVDDTWNLAIQACVENIDALYRERQDLSTGSEWNQGVFKGIELIRTSLLSLKK